MGFFSNRQINFLNAHVAAIRILFIMGQVFGPLRLYESGFSIAYIMFFFSAVSVIKIFIDAAALVFIRRLGLKSLLIAGILGVGLSMLCLSGVEGANAWFWGYAVLTTVFSPLYWLCFHTYFSVLGDGAHRGKQFAVREAASFIIAGLAPVMSGLVVQFSGFDEYFLLSVPLTIVSVLLLLPCDLPAIPVPGWREGRKFLKNLGFRAALFDGFQEMPNALLWPLILFLSSGNVIFMGGFLTLGFLMQALLQLVTGYGIDRGRRRLFAGMGAVFLAAALAGRSFLLLDAEIIIGLEFAFALAVVLYGTSLSVAIYNEAQSTGNALWSWFFCDAGHYLGGALGTGLIGALLLQGVSVRLALAVTLAGVAGAWFILDRHFRAENALRS